MVWALAAFTALTAVRLAVAAAVPLARDEAYYWVWSRALAPGYPDHPPMVALWIRIGTWFAGDGPLGIRLLGPITVALASLLLIDAGNRLLPDRNAGLRAAILLNATLMIGVGSVLMTPDVPLLVCWTACLWALARLLHSGNPIWWLVIGVFAGLAMASKYTAALLWFGIVLWLLVTPTQWYWLRRPQTWLGALLAVLLFLPVALWNAGHEWASFARQGGRLGTWHPAEGPRFLVELLAGQAGLATPLVFALCVGGVAFAMRRAWRDRDPAMTLLAALTLPGVALFVQHTLGDRVQGNWPAIIYPAAAIAAAALPSPRWQHLWRPAVALGLAITALAYVQAVFAALPLPVRFDPIALQLAGWNTLASEVETAREAAGADYVAADQYGVASELAMTLPPGVTVIGLDPRWSQFALPRQRLHGRVGILVHSANDLEPAGLPPSSATKLGEASRRQGTETIARFSLYRISATGEASGTVLPRPSPDGN